MVESVPEGSPECSEPFHSVFSCFSRSPRHPLNSLSPSTGLYHVMALSERRKSRTRRVNNEGLIRRPTRGRPDGVTFKALRNAPSRKLIFELSLRPGVAVRVEAFGGGCAASHFWTLDSHLLLRPSPPSSFHRSGLYVKMSQVRTSFTQSCSSRPHTDASSNALAP